MRPFQQQERIHASCLRQQLHQWLDAAAANSDCMTDTLLPGAWCRWFEVDQAEVLAVKQKVLHANGAPLDMRDNSSARIPVRVSQARIQSASHDQPQLFLAKGRESLSKLHGRLKYGL